MDKVFREHFIAALKIIGRECVTFHHHLHHFQGAMFSQVDGTTRETMARLGHQTVGAAMIYQNDADQRQRELAARLRRAAPKSADVCQVAYNALSVSSNPGGP